MGRGKTSAAIAYMADNPQKRFLYITPYLSEVDRICEACDFEDPDSETTTKLSNLKYLMASGRSIASTHSLFYRFDNDVLELIRKKHYCLIVDESINPVERIDISKKDFELVVDYFTSDLNGDGRLTWKDEEYSGKFSEYKDRSDSGSLYRIDSALMYVMSPSILRSFDEITMMTYLFDGQYQKAYLDYFGFEYSICGVDTDGHKYWFTDKPDSPPSLDYRGLIHIIDDDKFNSVGDRPYSLSKTWYEHRDRNHSDIAKLRNNMNVFFRKVTCAGSGKRLWTTFKSSSEKLDQNDRRYASSFLQLSARATNAYRSRDSVVYAVNRFVDPNLTKFFSCKGISVNEDMFALGEMLQFIWRSAIRDGKQITLYIPSKRMRRLMINWIESLYEGSDKNEQ